MFNALENYHQILKTELESRTRSNPRYSLRAFARDLGLSAPRLSRVLRGEQGLSLPAAKKIAERLGFAPGERERFCQLVLAVDARSKKKRKEASDRILLNFRKDPEVLLLETDSFLVISEWFHYAIVELTTTRGFKNDPKWIARRLGIHAIEAEGAVARLLRVGLLQEKSGKLVRSQALYGLPSQTLPSEAVRKFNRQILEKAIQAITLQSLEQRSLGTVTVAVDTKSLPRLFEELASFRRRFNKLAEELAQSTAMNAAEVYVLSLPFFRLSTPLQEKK